MDAESAHQTTANGLPSLSKQPMASSPYHQLHQASVRELNQHISRVSESFNQTPKPFKASTMLASSQNHGQQPQIRRSHQNSSSSILHKNNAGAQSQESLGSKLVHNQYNSPMSLYSMNNIRKTIEAHTEMVAPGVKGINFMKQEQPVNKQSEVYKLIKEQETSKASQGNTMDHHASSSLHPRESPMSTTSSSMASSVRFASSDVDAQHRHQHQHQQQYNQDQLPVCCECGTTIVGVYAMILGKSIHASCFNCSTCGTSLKNTGYFTINDKLYCDLHAKQMAKVLKLNSFAPLEPAHQPASASKSISTSVSHKMVSQDQDEQKFSKTLSSNLLKPSLPPTKGHQQQPYPLATKPPLESTYLRQSSLDHDRSLGATGRVPVCVNCKSRVQGTYILAGKSTWCKPCSQSSLICNSCRKSLLNVGFIEQNSNDAHLNNASLNNSMVLSTTSRYYCEHCYDAYFAPVCSRCHAKVSGDCLNAMDRQWHPQCFVCGHCKQPFGNSTFYIEDNVPYCEPDWCLLFTTKCYQCTRPIQAGDKWVEAMKRSYHSTCFRCASCQVSLEGSVFYCRAGKPYCRLHAN